MHFDPDLLAGTLAPFVTRLDGRSALTPSERTEVMRIAQGFAAKDSAEAANLSPETIRARRKRIYRKLGMRGGAIEVIAALLALSLRTLAGADDAAPDADAPAPGAPEEETAAGA